jgi:hypothetical protein
MLGEGQFDANVFNFVNIDKELMSISLTFAGNCNSTTVGKSARSDPLAHNEKQSRCTELF